ncbi:sensor histidine kinase [Actinokineospora sp. NBRC 105648]|uniref:sensor histidine kinase n=1 Tax=Actinokineospora sp. NBRC 105648 TaxID=3032206 RepID=UPI0024A4F304|nr:sensor histidine kinase [Actinokineospora sp. NBRC 105648]GLZ37026.1 two-component sensor histidine kinase [Actinokineospora sp. NBRC 105648]
MHDSGLRAVVARRWSRRALVAFDSAAAVAYTLVLLVVTLTHRSADTAPWWQCAVAAGIGLPGAVRRLWPVPVFAVVLAMTALGVATSDLREPFAAAAFALYAVALTEPRRRLLPTYVIGGVSLALLLVEFVVGTPGWWKDDLLDLLPTGLAMLGAAWTVGRAVRERRAYATRATGELAARVAAEERFRIARELHDVVAHSMGVVAVKAGVTRHLLATAKPDDPDNTAAVGEALRAIETTSRDALTEMRRMLGVLRTETTPDQLVPAPGVAELPDLVREAASVGVDAELRVRGAERLPEAMQLSVYRIVQEALTNVVKHAAPTRCRVTVEGTGNEVRIEVSDDGSPATPAATAPAGHGLVGMRERVAMYGGELTAGRRDTHGFLVSARLPYDPGGPR